MQQLLPIWMGPKHLTDDGCLCNVEEVGAETSTPGFCFFSSVCPPHVTDCIIQLQDDRKDLQYLGGLNSLCKQPLRRCQISGNRAHVKHAFNCYFYRYRRSSFLTRNALISCQQMMSLKRNAQYSLIAIQPSTWVRCIGVLLRNLALCTRHSNYVDNLHKAQLIPFSH